MGHFVMPGATETELMPKHSGCKAYGCNNGRYYGRKAYGRTLALSWNSHWEPGRYSRHLLDMNLHCLVDSRSIWVFISSSMVCPLYWARSPVGRFPNKPSQVIGACIFNDDSACCVQGGPTEIYYGNWSILYVWERFFNFSYISQTAYTELD